MYGAGHRVISTGLVDLIIFHPVVLGIIVNYNGKLTKVQDLCCMQICKDVSRLRALFNL